MGQALAEGEFRLVAQLGKFGDVRAAAGCATWGGWAGDNFDAASHRLGDGMGDIGNGKFFPGADVVDVAVGAFFEDEHEAVGEVVDVNEGAGFDAGALNGEGDGIVRVFAGQLVKTEDELGDNVFKSHVGAEDVVGAKNEDTLEVFVAVVEDHEFTDNFAAGIGVAGVERVGDGKGDGLIGGNDRRSLVDLGTAGEDEFGDVVVAAGVEDIDHTTNADVEDFVGFGVEEFRAVDKGKMADGVHPRRGGENGMGIANVGGDKVDFFGDILQTVGGAAGVIVEDADASAGVHKSAGKGGTDETGATGDKV